MRLTNILGDILVVGKAEAGGLGFDPIPHNLNSICEEIIIELKLSNQSVSEINFIDNFEPTFVMVDEKLLRHILINLLSNAIKYSEDGSPVYLTLSKQGEKIVIEVKDHGIGIPQEDQNCIFEPFTRATNVATINGTGLGLTIVKKSVELHGGEISFISKPGEGTIFTVTLDLKLC
jgi:signal transduction histidine kinase